MSDSNGFHMLQLILDQRRLRELGRMLRLPLREVDTGYLVHCLLGELFGENAPALFHVDESATESRQVTVLAYAELGLEPLRALAAGFAKPNLYEAIDWGASACKPMPAVFPKGMRLRFSTRLCPVVRLSSARGRFKKGSELDAFQAARLRGDERTHDDIYLEWTRRRLEAAGANAPTLRLDGHSTERLLRRGKKRADGRRPSHKLTRPVAHVSGELEIVDPEAFAELLRRGVGRHKGFGFGMLKLRRAGSR